MISIGHSDLSYFFASPDSSSPIADQTMTSLPESKTCPAATHSNQPQIHSGRQELHLGAYRIVRFCVLLVLKEVGCSVFDRFLDGLEKYPS